MSRLPTSNTSAIPASMATRVTANRTTVWPLWRWVNVGVAVGGVARIGRGGEQDSAWCEQTHVGGCHELARAKRQSERGHRLADDGLHAGSGQRIGGVRRYL